jgi:hypothetical protein
VGGVDEGEGATGAVLGEGGGEATEAAGAVVEEDVIAGGSRHEEWGAKGVPGPEKGVDLAVRLNQNAYDLVMRGTLRAWRQQ